MAAGNRTTTPARFSGTSDEPAAGWIKVAPPGPAGGGPVAPPPVTWDKSVEGAQPAMTIVNSSEARIVKVLGRHPPRLRAW